MNAVLMWSLTSSACTTGWISLLTFCQSISIRINDRVLRTILNTTPTNPLSQIYSTFPFSVKDVPVVSKCRYGKIRMNVFVSWQSVVVAVVSHKFNLF